MDAQWLEVVCRTSGRVAWRRKQKNVQCHQAHHLGFSDPSGDSCGHAGRPCRLQSLSIVSGPCHVHCQNPSDVNRVRDMISFSNGRQIVFHVVLSTFPVPKSDSVCHISAMMWHVIIILSGQAGDPHVPRKVWLLCMIQLPWRLVCSNTFKPAVVRLLLIPKMIVRTYS